jgi:energy-coupling factor transport system permease protein
VGGFKLIPAYRKNDSFCDGLHPATQLFLTAALVVTALVSENPFMLLSVILATAVLAWSADVFSEWLSWWKICLFVGLAALVINPLVSGQGATVIWQGPRIPVFGRLDITLEAVAYGAGMGLRLAAMIWAFALLTLIMDPDRALGLMRGRGSRSALATALALRMVPAAVGDAGDLLDAQRSRGIVRDRGGRRTRMKTRLPLVKRLVSTSLDRGISLAEAMESRGFGSGRRTRYNECGFGPGDLAVLVLSLAFLGAVIGGTVTGAISFTYYPSLFANLSAGGLAIILAPLAAAVLMLAVSTAWKRWHWLKLRT